MKCKRSARRRQLVEVLVFGLLLAGLVSSAGADEAGNLSKVAPDVLSKEQRREAAGMIDRDISRRTNEANARNREEWAKIKTREQWEKYRDERIASLRKSLGDFPPPPEKLNVKV